MCHLLLVFFSKALFSQKQFSDNIGARDCPYRVCCPWVHEGWDLHALGKFSCRHRRRRRVLARFFLNGSSDKNIIFVSSFVLKHMLDYFVFSNLIHAKTPRSKDSDIILSILVKGMGKSGIYSCQMNDQKYLFIM